MPRNTNEFTATDDDDRILREMHAACRPIKDIAEALGWQYERTRMQLKKRGLRSLSHGGFRMKPGSFAQEKYIAMHTGWPQINPLKAWPIGCFEGHDVDRRTLNIELQAIGKMAVSRYVKPGYGEPFAYG